MEIEEAFNKLTGDTDNKDNGKIRGTTKQEVRELCGNDWDEKAWRRMITASNIAKSRVSNELPFYDKKQRRWFWY